MTAAWPRSPWWLVAGFAVAAVALYAAGLRGPFLMDDYDAIFVLAGNEAAGMSWREVLANAPAHIRGRVLANFTFLLSQAAAGSPYPPSPLSYKLGNLLVHLACGVATFLLARRIAFQWGAGAARAQAAAALAAGLFLLHPLLVSTVLYPVQRMAQLSTLFVLLAVLAYVHWREGLATRSARASWLLVAATLACTALAVLGKENGVLAPVLIAVVEWTVFRWPARGAPERERFETGFGLVCAAPLVLGAVLFGLRRKAMVAAYADREFTMGERLLTQLHVLADYLGQIAWPRIAAMGLYRDDVAVVRALDASTVALGVVLVAAVVAAVAWRRRAPAAALAVLWFLGAHALESSVVSLELVFEHRNYLALFGPALAAAWAITALPRRAAVAAALAACAVLSVQTARRVLDWRDYDTWIRAEAAHHPASLRAGTDLATWLAGAGHAGEAAAAVASLHARFPRHAQPVIVDMAVHCDGRTAFELSPADRARLATGFVGKDAFHVFGPLKDRVAEGRCAALDWDDLVAATGAIASNPSARRTPMAAAAWHRVHAQALVRRGDWAAADAALRRALEHRDNDPRDWLLLMRLALEQGQPREFAAARRRLLWLLDGQPGSLGSELRQLDADAARRFSSPAPLR